MGNRATQRQLASALSLVLAKYCDDRDIAYGRRSGWREEDPVYQEAIKALAQDAAEDFTEHYG